jgi:hypothetical protein
MQWIDLMVVAAGNLMNLLLAGMFLMRGRGKPGAGQILGWAAVVPGLPLVFAALQNFLLGRSWPFWVLPGITALYCALEWILDGILKVDFRHNRLLGPYLALYYLGLMALIGYAFLVSKPAGFFTLLTYFANLAATYYGYSRAGHG